MGDEIILQNKLYKENADLRTRNEALVVVLANIAAIACGEEQAADDDIGGLRIIWKMARAALTTPTAAPAKHADSCSYPECACSCGEQPTPTTDVLRLAGAGLDEAWQILLAMLEEQVGHDFDARRELVRLGLLGNENDLGGPPFYKAYFLNRKELGGPAGAWERPCECGNCMWCKYVDAAPVQPTPTSEALRLAGELAEMQSHFHGGDREPCGCHICEKARELRAALAALPERK